MKDNFKDKSNKTDEQQKLVDYINQTIPDSSRHEFEKQTMEDEFVNDAVEGLNQIKDKKNIASQVNQLNAALNIQLKKRKKRIEKRKLPQQPWLYFAIILIMLLIIIAYLVIYVFSS